MNRWRRLVRMRPVWFTLLLAAAVTVYQLWIGIAAAAKLEAAGLDRTAGSADLMVTLSVSPEQFHMVALQDAGRLIRMEGNRAYLSDVPPASMRSLARRYWIREVMPWSEP